MSVVDWFTCWCIAGLVACGVMMLGAVTVDYRTSARQARWCMVGGWVLIAAAMWCGYRMGVPS